MDAEAIRDLLQDLGPVRITRMFGGLGIFKGERMFAIVVADELYLKADDHSRPAFEEAGSRPFVYHRDEKAVSLGYWLMPDEGLDDPSEAARWGRLAVEAADRAANFKSKGRKRRA